MSPIQLSIAVLTCAAIYAFPEQATGQPKPKADNPPVIEVALKLEGARVTLPVSAAISKKAFTPEFVRKARKNFNNFHFQMGGDHALYYSMHLEEFMPTAESAPNKDYRPLERAINRDLASLKQRTSKGDLSLADYMTDPLYRAQGMIMIHKGKVVYESYPGMKPTDRHLTASTGKITAGLIMAQLVAEGKVDLQKPITDYVPELKGSAWDEITTSSVANMTTGLSNEETIEAILNPKSKVTRFLAAISGSRDPVEGKLIGWIDAAKLATKIEGEKQGDVMRYSSVNTTVLTQLIENVEKKPFAEVFEERAWSKLHARRSILFNLTPDGLALPVGFVAATLEDYARFGLQFTPSWKAAASERVVDEKSLAVIYKNMDKARYVKSVKRPTSEAQFNEAAVGNAMQFDYIWDDGAIAKSGNLCQMIYIDPKRDFVSVYFSTCPFVDGYGEFKAGAYQRAAAKFLADE